MLHIKHCTRALQGALVLFMLAAVPAIGAARDHDKDRLNPPDSTWTSPTQEEFKDQPQKHDRVTNKSDADMQLESQVGAALGSYKDIRVDADKGVVTLTGSVSSEQEKDAAISRAGAVSGVSSVNSDLQIIK